jgi:hypothetical protein
MDPCRTPFGEGEVRSDKNLSVQQTLVNNKTALAGCFIYFSFCLQIHVSLRMFLYHDRLLSFFESHQA